MRALRSTLTLLQLAALSLLAMSASAATVYKWVDENGVTHYSDQPHPNAKEMTIDSAQTYSSAQRPTAPSSAAAAATAAETAGPAYSLCEIYRPETEEVFMNTHTVTAKVRLEPQLRPEHRVAIALDGKRLLNQPATATEFVITDVERGTHSVLVVVEDRQGNALCTTSAVTFHVRQPSVQAPVRSVRPKF